MSFFSDSLALGTTGILCAAGVSHLLRSTKFIALIREQEVVPERLSPHAATIALSAELILGVGGVLLVISGVDNVARIITMLAAATLYLIFGAYLLIMVQRGSVAPCGCSGGDEPPNAWSVGRAFVLSAASAFAAFTSGSSGLPEGTFTYSTVLLLSSASLGLLVWSLPAAFTDPVDPITGGR